MLELDDKLLIGKGMIRSCYQHPINQNQCVKILHPTSPLKNQTREIRYFKHLEKVGASWEYVAAFVKTEETNFGLGAVFNLVRDKDGQISKSIKFYLKQDVPEINTYIVHALEEMKQHLWEQNIIFRDLNPSNILLQKNSETDFQLKVIDGVGHNDLIPICHFAYFGRKKIERMWNRRLKKWFGKYKNVYPLLIPYR